VGRGRRAVGGALALLGVIAATVAFENPQLQLYALGGVVLGIPFTFWRAPRSKLAREEAAEAGSTAPTI